MFSKALLTSTLIAAVSAHQNLHQLWVNGETPGYQVGIRMPPSNSPVTDVTSKDIACNVNGSKAPSGVATVPAAEGDTIKVQWDQSGHPGPITHFLYGPVTDATMATGIGSWVKIDELDYVNGTWANAIMEANNMTHEFKLPTGLASGEYLLRSEMLALHGAQTVGGAQFYIGCAQLKITGTGGSCSPAIELPGAYKATDADIYIPNVYNGFDPTNYTAPGGPVATCGGSGSGKALTTTAASKTTVAVSSAVAAPSTTAVAISSAAAISSVTTISSVAAISSAAAVSSVRVSFISSIQAAAPTSSTASVSSVAALSSTLITSVAPASTVAVSATATSVAGSVAKYGQCGGTNYKGTSACADGVTCKVQNPYYSQCV